MEGVPTEVEDHAGSEKPEDVDDRAQTPERDLQYDIEQEQGYTEKFATLRQLIAEGGSYTRQRKIFAEFGSLVKVAEANSRAFGMNDPNAVILP